MVEDQGEANTLIVGCEYIVFATFAVLLAIGRPLSLISNATIFKTYWYMLPIGVLCFGLYNVSLYASLRDGSHKVIAKTRLSQALGGVIIQTSLGAINFGPIGLAIGQVFGISAGLFTLQPPAKFYRRIREERFAVLKEVIFRHSAYAKYDSPAAILNVANNQLPPVVIAFLFSPFAAGVYALVQRVMLTPLSILAASISNSLMSSGRELLESGGEPIARIGSASMALGPIFLLISLLCPLTFGRIFGENWQGAGILAAWISLISAPKFSFDSVSILLSANGMQALMLKMQTCMSIFRLACLYFGSVFLSLTDTILLFSIVSALGYAVSASIVQVKVGRLPLKNSGLTFLDTLIPFVIVMAIYRWDLPYQATAAIVIMCSSIILLRVRPHLVWMVDGLRKRAHND